VHTRAPWKLEAKKNAVSLSRERRVGARQPSAVSRPGPRHLTFLSVQGVDWGRVLVQHWLYIQPSNFALQEYKHHGHSRCHHRIRHLHPPRYVHSTSLVLQRTLYSPPTQPPTAFCEQVCSSPTGLLILLLSGGRRSRMPICGSQLDTTMYSPRGRLVLPTSLQLPLRSVP
jgi:hypothetical protein